MCLNRFMKVEQCLLSKRCSLFQHIIDQINSPGVPHHLLMVFQGFARNGQSLFKNKGGFSQGQGVALNGCRCVGPQIA